MEQIKDYNIKKIYKFSDLDILKWEITLAAAVIFSFEVAKYINGGNC
jgi:hypothetical protein